MEKAWSSSAKAKPGETVIFAWIVYESRAHRDLVNKKMMKDPQKNPFDPRQLACGGFKVIVDARAGGAGAPTQNPKPRNSANWP